MGIFIQTIIYLLAVLGIIITTMSFFESYIYKNNSESQYKFYRKNYMKNKHVEIIININGFNENEENEIIDKIKNGKYENIEEVADEFKIIKS